MRLKPCSAPVAAARAVVALIVMQLLALFLFGATAEEALISIQPTVVGGVLGAAGFLVWHRRHDR